MRIFLCAALGHCLELFLIRKFSVQNITAFKRLSENFEILGAPKRVCAVAVSVKKATKLKSTLK
jgi:hypothetical protein